MLRPYAIALALSPLAQDALQRAAVAPVVRLQVDGHDRAGQVLQDLPLDLVADGVRFLHRALGIDDEVHVHVAGRAGPAAAQAVKAPDVVRVGGDDVVEGPQLVIGQGDVHDLAERLPGEVDGGPGHVGGQAQGDQGVEQPLVRDADGSEAGDDRRGLDDVRLQVGRLRGEGERLGAAGLAAHVVGEDNVGEGGGDHWRQADDDVDLRAALHQ